MKLPHCSFAKFWITISVLYGVFFVGAEFAGSPLAGAKGLVALLAQWFVVSVSATSVLGLLALSRTVFAVIFPILITASATVIYFRLTLGTALTPAVIELAAVNKASTWLTLVSWQLVVVLILALLLSVATVVYRFRYVSSAVHSWLWTAILLLLMLSPVCFITRFKDPVTARVPYVFWYSTSEYLAQRRNVETARHTFENITVTSGTDSLTVVVVIGESLRADHLGLNGYYRNTTPKLSSDTAVVSLPRMHTDYYYTHTSVPQILTRADSEHPLRAYDEQSFISLFNLAGFRTAWLSNQDQVNTYVYFMHEADTLVQCNAHRNLYSYDKWLDSDMLPDYRMLLEGGDSRQLLVLHAIGSHWWYRSHYPDSLAVFTPEIDSRVVSELSHEQIINSYDNTVLATDALLSALIKELHTRCAVLVYISDHGESLGEEGRFLHAADGPELHTPAALVWYSPEYALRFPQKISALRSNAEVPMSTDVIFNSVLDAGDLRSEALDTTRSIFRHAFRH